MVEQKKQGSYKDDSEEEGELQPLRTKIKEEKRDRPKSFKKEHKHKKDKKHKHDRKRSRSRDEDRRDHDKKHKKHKEHKHYKDDSSYKHSHEFVSKKQQLVKSEQKVIEAKEEEYNENIELVDQISEDEVLQRQREERERRIKEIRQKYGQKQEPELTNGNSISIIDYHSQAQTHDHQIVGIEAQGVHNQSDLSEQVQVIRIGFNDSQAEQVQQTDYYRLLDQQRNQWYSEQIQRQHYNQVEEHKQEKKFDMFNDLSDDEDEQNNNIQNALQKGIKINVASVDKEGYYLPRVGEMINGRYITKGVAGKGVFSCVVKAVDTHNNQLEVAIKIIRKIDITRMSGEKEKEIIQILNKADPADKKHIIRLYESFDYNDHLCMVFESLEMNLRETLNKFGKNIGLSLDGVCLFGRQLFVGLSLLHKLKLIHADLKPDNIMVNKDNKKIKICDFGSCLKEKEVSITQYMVSRYYRAPEIILGLQFNQQIDIWSAAVSLFELYTGRIMFPGRSNNEMLKLIMQTKGKIKNKLLRKAEFLHQHFHPQNNNIFLMEEEDPLKKGSFYTKPVNMPQSSQKPILQQLKQATSSDQEDPKSLQFFADFLEKTLVIDPAKRMTADQALTHPFLNILTERQQNLNTKSL